MSQSKEFILPVRVYIEDTDAGGIVYYVNYLKFIERSRTEFLRTLGYGKAAVLEDGLLLVVKNANVNYISSAYLDDELAVSTQLKTIANTYVVFYQTIHRGDQKLFEADVKVACVRPDTDKQAMRPARIPKVMSEALKAQIEN
jgi:4-hydroxybenzoyl-CoA thioesterase/acyl-CoA thioester hydrolase